MNYDDLEALVEAMAEQCPRCGAAPNVMCANVLTGDPLHAYHWQRRPAVQPGRDGSNPTGPVSPDHPDGPGASQGDSREVTSKPPNVPPRLDM